MRLLVKDVINTGIHPEAIVYATLNSIDLKEAIDKETIFVEKIFRDLIRG